MKNFLSKTINIIESSHYEFPINPASLTTAQEKGVRIIKMKNGKCIPTFFKKAPLVKEEKMLKEYFSKVTPFKAPIADNEGVVLTITYIFPFPSGTPKKVLEGGMTLMTKRPDIDNISKAVIDMMTECKWWKDDGQIVTLCINKFRGAEPMMSVDVAKVSM